MSDPIDQMDHYDKVINELEAKKQVLDNAIQAVKEAKALATGVAYEPSSMPASGGGSLPPASNNSVNIQSDAFFNMRVPDAIKKYLTIVKRPKSPNEISDALKAGGINSTAASFYSVVTTALRRLAADEEVVKVKKDWGLASWYPGRNKIQKPKEETIQKEKS
jgi:hypothetical protein